MLVSLWNAFFFQSLAPVSKSDVCVYGGVSMRCFILCSKVMQNGWCSKVMPESVFQSDPFTGSHCTIFSETVNAITSKRPLVRRSLQQSWDLAFMWFSFEPTTHHVAMPHQVLVAVLSTALYWGGHEKQQFLLWLLACC